MGIRRPRPEDEQRGDGVDRSVSGQAAECPTAAAGTQPNLVSGREAVSRLVSSFVATRRGPGGPSDAPNSRSSRTKRRPRTPWPRTSPSPAPPPAPSPPASIRDASLITLALTSASRSTISQHPPRRQRHARLTRARRGTAPATTAGRPCAPRTRPDQAADRTPRSGADVLAVEFAQLLDRFQPLAAVTSSAKITASRTGRRSRVTPPLLLLPDPAQLIRQPRPGHRLSEVRPRPGGQSEVLQPRAKLARQLAPVLDDPARLARGRLDLVVRQVAGRSA